MASTTWVPALQPVTALINDVVSSSGRSLDPATREIVGGSLGHDFAHIQIHDDSRAAASALHLGGGKAYTVGSHVVFAPGRFAPHTAEGRRLLIHELVHVLQQTEEGAGEADSLRRSATFGGAAITIEDQTSPAEQEAQSIAARVSTAGKPTHLLRTRRSVQRAAPATVGIGALAWKCIISAVAGVALDLVFQAASHIWRGRDRLSFQVDKCSLVLSAILSCIGGVVAARWLGPWIDAALGPRLAGIAGPLVGRVLLAAQKLLGIGIPKFALKTLLKLGCVSPEQAEAITPGIAAEERIAAEVPPPREEAVVT